jgi:hypothetical protein
MLSGDAMFEAVAISITSATEVNELTRKVASCVNAGSERKFRPVFDRL